MAEMNFKFLLTAFLLFSGFSSAERDEAPASIIERQEELKNIEKKRAERQEELRKIKKQRARKQKERQEDDWQSRQFELEKIEIRKILNNLGQIRPEEMPMIKRSNPMVHGIILEFNEWPPAEEKAISAELKSNGLEEDAKLKRFKIWIYKYPQPRKVEEAKKLCDVFINFKSVQSCESDISVQPQQSRGEFYKEQLKRAEEGYERAKKDYEKAKEDKKKAEEEHKKIKGMHDQDLKIKENAELDIQNNQQAVERARQILERAKKRNNPQEITEAEKRLKDREQILAGSKEWLKKAVKFYEGSLKEFKDSESWVKESEKWLDNRRKNLQTKEDWLKEVRSKKPPQEPAKKPEPPKTKTPDQPKTKTPDQPKTPEPPKQIKEDPATAEAVNVKTCKVVSSKLNVHPYIDRHPKSAREIKIEEFKQSTKGSLSDYWAQEMIGADLLKEMLKKQAPVGKKTFILLFDRSKHGEYVKNIISSDGRHSVLPNLGGSIRTFKTNTVGDYLKNSDKLLSERDKACAGSSNKPTNQKSGGQR